MDKNLLGRTLKETVLIDMKRHTKKAVVSGAALSQQLSAAAALDALSIWEEAEIKSRHCFVLRRLISFTLVPVSSSAAAALLAFCK